MSTTFRSWPEYKSVEAFVEFVIDDERSEFDWEDLQYLNYRTRQTVQAIRAELESYGLKMQVREPERQVRGFTTSSNDRWFGPGSCPTHGGSGFDNRPF